MGHILFNTPQTESGLNPSGTYTWGERGIDDYSGVTADTFIRTTPDPDNNNGVAEILLISNDNFQSIFGNLLIKFDLSALSGLMSASSQITTAKLYVRFNDGQTGHQVDCHRVIRDWGEGAKDNAAATSGEATWNSAKHSVDSWGTVGCENTTNDRLAAISDSAVAAATGYFDWDVTVDVKAFFDGANNYGWVMRCPTGGFLQTLNWDSSEYTTLLFRPYLEIIF